MKIMPYKPNHHRTVSYFVHRKLVYSIKILSYVNHILDIFSLTNWFMCHLLKAFKEKRGFGVLCNIFLNFNGAWVINNLSKLEPYVEEHPLDRFAFGEKCYLGKHIPVYECYKYRLPHNLQ